MPALRCGDGVHRPGKAAAGAGWLLGDLPNLVAGALETAIFTCPKCGKLEFFRGDFFDDEGEEPGKIAQTRCSGCGVLYDMDYPKCPRCGAKNENW